MIFLATNNGLLTVDPAANWQVTGHTLQGHRVIAVSTLEETVLAGTTQGIYRSTDRGETWHEINDGLNHPHVRWLAVRSKPYIEWFAGTEPAAIFIASGDKPEWRERDDVSRLRDLYNWSLPYSPAAGCIRGFAFHGDRAYAAVEVGGVLRSDDLGSSWRLAGGSDGHPRFSKPAESFVHPDVHSIDVHPSSPELVFASTGGGFFTSSDGGTTWICRYECYVRAAWVDPQDPAHIILGPADGVDRNGRIEETSDSGLTWMPAGEGLSLPWSNHMVERFTPAASGLAAVLSNGEVLFRPSSTKPWHSVLSEAVGVNAIAV